MNALLEKAIAEVARLPEAAQETIARLILDEIEAERGWDERFAKSQDQLGELVRSARAEVGAARCSRVIRPIARDFADNEALLEAF